MVKNPLNVAFIGLIWLYRRSFSPIFYLFGARCRHTPSCSAYAAEAFHKHEFIKAFWLAISRISRCHPFGSSGYDPVPDDAPAVGWRFWRHGDWRWTERGGGVQEP